jgi:hypothetical protein
VQDLKASFSRAGFKSELQLARAGEPAALQAIREIADRLDGKPKQEAEVTLRQALASELTDDDLAASNGESPPRCSTRPFSGRTSGPVLTSERSGGRLAALNRGLCRNIANRMQI